jgi:hypothetical protein
MKTQYLTGLGEIRDIILYDRISQKPPVVFDSTNNWKV